MYSEEEKLEPCEVDWHAVASICGSSHHCALLKGHTGPHICDCGTTRRLLERDEPERFEK